MTTANTLVLSHSVSPDLSSELVPALENRLSPEAIANSMTPDDTRELVSDANMVVVGQLHEQWLEDTAGPNLVQTLWAGVDTYPLDSLEEAGVALANAAGIHAKPVAEHVLASMLQFERGLIETGDNQRRGVWEAVDCGELGTRTVGIIGVGAIGSRVARLTSAFGMETIGTKRDTSTAPDTLDEVVSADAYHELLRRVDYLVLSCPLTEQTEKLLGADEFRLLDSDAVVVNVARGEVVDQQALTRALQYGQIGGAALDVFEEEPLPPDSTLWDLSNVLITPHMAWKTPHTVTRWVDLLTENYEAVTAGDRSKIVNRVV